MDSAVIWGSDRAEWVVHRWWEDGPGARVYELRNPAGTTAVLRIERPDGSGSGPLKLAASVGPFGDQEMERRLLSVVSRRLSQLHSVDAATIR